MPPELVKFSITNSTITPSVVQRLRKVCRPTPTKRIPAEYSQAMPQIPHSPWSTMWNSGPANSVPSTLTTNDTPTTSIARNRIGSAPPAPPSTATEAYEPMLIATSRKNSPCPVGSPGAGRATSVTVSGTPWALATGVKTLSTAVASVSEPAEATSSCGALPGM